MTIAWPPKGPGETLDYLFDFTPVLAAGEKIAGRALTVTGVTKASDAIVPVAGRADAGVQLVLSAGARGTVARIECTVTTDSSPQRVFTELAVLPIGGGPIGLAEMKAYLRVEGDEEDQVIAALLGAAVSAIETQTGKYLSPRVHRQVARDFGRTGLLRLHRGPVQEIIRVAFDPASGGAEELLASWRLVEGADGGLQPAAGASFPLTWPSSGAVRIDYLAGYEAEDVPAELVQAAKMLCAHWFANREAVNVGNITSEMPLAVRMLIDPFCPVGLA